MKRRAGYILVETIVSLGLLSVGMIVIQSAIRQAILTRGQAEDYTRARFLLEQIVSEKLIQPELMESKGQGEFKENLSRFSYEWEIGKAEIPRPVIPPTIPPEQRKQLEKEFKGWMGKLHVRISWSRAGIPFEISGDTLFKPEQLWQPPSDKS